MSFKASDKTLGDLLRDKKNLTVPWYQRFYDWSSEEVEELLEDLDEAIEENRTFYFLGSVILVDTGNSRCEINDGQQRIITVSLMCAALCHIFHEANMSAAEGNAINLLFDVQPHTRVSLSNASEYKLRLSTSSGDELNYSTIIRRDQSVSNGHKITGAWKAINEFFFTKHEEDTEFCQNFFYFLSSKVKVACIEMTKDLNPNTVFETLNCRGKELGQAELIKNHLSSFFNERRQEPQRIEFTRGYERIFNNLGYQPTPKMMSEYIRCYAQASNGIISEKRFYRDFRNKVLKGVPNARRAEFILDFVKDLNDKVAVYRDFVATPPPLETLRSNRIDERLLDGPRNMVNYLNDLKGYSVAYPILFSLFCKIVNMNGQDNRQQWRFVNQCCKVLSSFIARIAHTQRGFQPSHFERDFAEIARAIWNESCLTEQDFLQRIRRSDENRYHVLNDDNYIDLLQKIEFPHAKKVKLLLGGIVAYRQPDIMIRDQLITLEHVLPKSVTHGSEWKEFSSERHVRYRYRLGNLTLLYRGDNKPGANFNRSFTHKKRIYEASSLRLTRDISRNESWNVEKIERRSEKLAREAAKIWNFDISRRGRSS